MTEFAGFPQPTKNFFSLPNEIINIIADITNLSELKVILYVIRHTWGYQEFGICKTISIDEFMKGRRYKDGSRMDKGTGLSRQGVLDGLERAVKDGYLICEVDASDLGRTRKSYRLKMLGGVNDLDGVHKLDPVYKPDMGGSTIQTPGVNDSDTRGLNSRHRSEKETLERKHRNTPEKENEERGSNENRTSPLSRGFTHSHSSVDSVVSQGGATDQPASVKEVSQPSVSVDTCSSSYPLERANERVFSSAAGVISSHTDTLNHPGDDNDIEPDDARQAGDVMEKSTAELHRIAMLPRNGHNITKDASPEQHSEDTAMPPFVENQAKMQDATDAVKSEVNETEDYTKVSESANEARADTNGSTGIIVTQGQLTQAMMIEWVKDAGGKVSKRNGEKNKQTYAILLKEGIKTLQDVEKLVTEALHFYAPDDIWFGNLVEERILKRYRALCPKVIQPPPKVDLPQMEIQILSRYPDICINPLPDANLGDCMQLWYGEGDKDYWLLRDLDDWHSVESDQDGMLKAALTYGKQYLLQAH